jgi:hypothetical protein
MADQELLELAAKAAGYLNWAPTQSGLFIETGHSRGNTGFHWNPLTDDGDALRLAVSLCLLVDCYSHCARALPDSLVWEEGSGLDDCANTRRAIVRAAAEIGKQRNSYD